MQDKSLSEYRFYIEKILQVDCPDFGLQKSKTIFIPLSNKVVHSDEILSQLMFYARRSKLMGAFNKFNYQYNELTHTSELNIVQRFIDIITKFDFWDSDPQWPALHNMKEQIEHVRKLITTQGDARIALMEKHLIFHDNIDYYKVDEILYKFEVIPLWDRLRCVGNIFEEICKEWYLPTHYWLGVYLSNE